MFTTRFVFKKVPSGFPGLHRSKSIRVGWKKKHLGLYLRLKQSGNPSIHTSIIWHRLSFSGSRSCLFRAHLTIWRRWRTPLISRQFISVHHRAGVSIWKWNSSVMEVVFRKERRKLNAKLITRLPDNSRKQTECKSLYSRMRMNPNLYVSCLSIKPPWSLLMVVFYRILSSELKSGKSNKSGSDWDSLLLLPLYLFLAIFQTLTWKTLVLNFNCDEQAPAFSSKALSPLQM